MIYSLSYDTRRFLYAVLNAREFYHLQKQKKCETTSSYSYKPFIQNQCIFVHIPKAAGISVCKSLFNNLAGGHETIEKYQIVFSKEEFDRFFKFTFVRNPWDRLFSAYNFLKKGGINSQDKKWASANLSEYKSFDDFVKRWVINANINKYIHFVPQYKFLSLTKKDKLDVDFLGYFENIENDFKYIVNKLSMDPELSLKYENKTGIQHKKMDYREHYTHEAREIVSEVYKKDILVLGYNFDNSSLKMQLANRSV